MATPSMDDLPDTTFEQLAEFMKPQTESARNFLKVAAQLGNVHDVLLMLEDTTSGMREDNTFWNAKQESRLGDIYRLLNSTLPVLRGGGAGAAKTWEMWQSIGNDVDAIRAALVNGVHTVTGKKSDSDQTELLQEIASELEKLGTGERISQRGAPVVNCDRRSLALQLEHTRVLGRIEDYMVLDRKACALENRVLRDDLTLATAEQTRTWIATWEPIFERDSRFRKKSLEALDRIQKAIEKNGGGGGLDIPLPRPKGPAGPKPNVKVPTNAPQPGRVPTTAPQGGTKFDPRTPEQQARIRANQTPSTKVPVDAPAKVPTVGEPTAAPKYRIPGTAPATPTVPDATVPKYRVPGGAPTPAPTPPAASPSWWSKATDTAKGWFGGGKTPPGTPPEPSAGGGMGKWLGRAGAALTVGLGAKQIYDTQNDDTKTQEEKNKHSAAITADVGGTLAGAWAGALGGAAVGSIIPGAGTLIGGGLGLLGGLAGGIFGGVGARTAANSVLGIDDTGHNVDRAAQKNQPQAAVPKPPAAQQRTATAGAVPAAATGATALKTVTAQPAAKPVDNLPVADMNATALADGNRAYKEMADPNSKFGSVDRNKINQLMSRTESPAAASKTNAAFDAMNWNSAPAAPFTPSVKAGETLQAAYVPPAAGFSSPVGAADNRSLNTDLASAATTALAAITGSSTAQASTFDAVRDNAIAKQTAQLEKPLTGMRTDMSSGMTSFRSEQSELTRESIDTQQGFFSKMLSALPGVSMAVKAAEILADPAEFWKKSQSVVSDAWGAAKSGAQAAVNIFNGTNSERDAGKKDNRSVMQRGMDALSGGWNTAKNTYNQSAPSAASGMTDFTFRHEAGKAGYSAVNMNDVGGIAYGKIQFNSRSGKLKNVIDDYMANGDKTSSNYQTIAKYRDAINRNDMGTISKSSELKAALQGAGKEDAMQKAQDKSIMSEYGNPALKAMGQAGLKSLAAQQVLFDTKVNGGMESVMSSTMKKMGGRVGDTVNGKVITEKDFLNTYVDQRQQRLLNLASAKEAKGDTKAARDLRAVATTSGRMSELKDLIAKNGDVRADNTKAGGGAQMSASGKVVTTTGGVIDPTFGHRYDGDVKKAKPNDGLLKVANDTLYAETQKAMDKGVKYGFGSKNSSSGAIDCSGWVAELQGKAMDSVNAAAGKQVFTAKDKAAMKDSSEGIIQTIGNKTGNIMNNAQLAQTGLREGMVIGMDTGQTKFDAGRKMGIDHVVNVLRDPKSGQLMVSESRGGKGVSMTSADKWMETQQKKGTKLYGVDPMEAATGAGADALKSPGLPTATTTQQVPGAGVPGVPDMTSPMGTAVPSAGGEAVPSGDAGSVLYQAGQLLIQAANMLMGKAGDATDKDKPAEDSAQANAAAGYANAQQDAQVIPPAEAPGTATETATTPPMDTATAIGFNANPLAAPEAATATEGAADALTNKNYDINAATPNPIKVETFPLSNGTTATMTTETLLDEANRESAEVSKSIAATVGTQPTFPDATLPGASVSIPVTATPTTQVAAVPVVPTVPTPAPTSSVPSLSSPGWNTNVPSAAPMTIDGLLRTVGSSISGATGPLSTILNVAGRYNTGADKAGQALGALGNLSTQQLFGSNMPIGSTAEMLRRVGSVPLTTNPASLAGWVAPETTAAMQSVLGTRSGEGATVPLSTPGWNPSADVGTMAPPIGGGSTRYPSANRNGGYGGSGGLSSIIDVINGGLSTAGGIGRDINGIGSIFGKSLPDSVTRVLNTQLPGIGGMIERATAGTKVGSVLQHLPEVNDVLGALSGGGMKIPSPMDVFNSVQNGMTYAGGSSGVGLSIPRSSGGAIPDLAMSFAGSQPSRPTSVESSVDASLRNPPPASAEDMQAVMGAIGSQPESTTYNSSSQTLGMSNGAVQLSDINFMLDEANDRMMRA